MCIVKTMMVIAMLSLQNTWVSLGMRPANERGRYIVTTSLIGRAYTYTDP